MKQKFIIGIVSIISFVILPVYTGLLVPIVFNEFPFYMGIPLILFSILCLFWTGYWGSRIVFEAMDKLRKSK